MKLSIIRSNNANVEGSSMRLAIVIFACLCLSQEGRTEVTIGFNFYPYLRDVRSDADLTINAHVVLPAGFSYYTFSNFGGLFHSGSLNYQISEQNLRWKIADRFPVELVVQDTIRYGSDNDTVHGGIRWRLHDTAGFQSLLNTMHLNYSVHLFPIRFDQRDRGGWQISHSYQLMFPYISERLYLSGFLDHNVKERTATGARRDNIITETQFGVRLFSKVYAVVEYRINEYRLASESNLGVGIELKTNW